MDSTIIAAWIGAGAVVVAALLAAIIPVLFKPNKEDRRAVATASGVATHPDTSLTVLPRRPPSVNIVDPTFRTTG